MPDFVPGLRLAERLCRDAVAPFLAREFPRLPYAAALVGTGFEVLGFDTERSTDHEWGPRLVLFLLAADADRHAANIRERLRSALPPNVLGFPTNVGATEEPGIRHLVETNGPVDHKVEVTTVAAFLTDRLGIADWRSLAPVDWLLFT